MNKKQKGGMETIIATIIIMGVVVALIWAVVKPMSESGEDLLGTATDSLAEQSVTIGPGI